MAGFGDEATHELDQVVVEQGVVRGLIDAERDSFDDLDVAEADSFQFRDEDTLRQGSRYSAGPGRRVYQHLRRQISLVDGEV